jgi:hypothetical protein
VLAESRRFIRSAGIQELPDGTVSAHYEFGHSLYRAFLYGRLSAVSRARLHRSVAQQLETLYSPDRQELAPTLALHFYALGSMSESARAYEMAATRAAQAGLAGAHAHALICQAPPFGLIDPDWAVAAVEPAVEGEIPKGTRSMRARFMAAVLRLLYDRWREEDWEICSALAPGAGARLLCEALTRASAEAAGLLESALKTAEHTLHAQAWEKTTQNTDVDIDPGGRDVLDIMAARPLRSAAHVEKF